MAIRAVALLAVLAAAARVIASSVVPDGRLSFSTDLAAPSPFVSQPKPSERLDIEGGKPFRLLADPVYLDVKSPGKFDAVTVTVRYLNRSQPVVEIGALANRLDGQFDLHPAENRLVDSLSWHRVSSGDLMLLQRERKYGTLDDFLVNPPDPSKIAVYRADVSWPYRLADYHPLDEPKTRTVSLRGHHRMLTYTGGEPLSFSFEVQDMNRQAGADPVTVSIYKEGETVAAGRTILSDDGNTRDDQRSSGLRTVAVSLPKPAPGLYRVEFTSSDDVFMRSMTTRQAKVTFMGSVYLGDYVGYSDSMTPAEVVVGGRMLTARTAHPEGLQTLMIDGQPLELRETHTQQFTWLGNSGATVRVISTKRDVLLETDGLFALSPDDYFSPKPRDITWYMASGDLDSEGIDYVVTGYEPPKFDGDATEAVATFEVSNLAVTEEGEYRFVVSAPGIGITGKDLRIERVTFTFSREATGWARGLSRLFDGADRQAGDRETAIILPSGKSYGEVVE